MPGMRQDRSVAFPLDQRLLLELGGSRQRVHVLAARAGLPGLLVLHGGPGVPNRHLVVRHLGELRRHFTLILWDQRGTGGSYRPRTQGPLSIARLVVDAAELATTIRDRFELPALDLLGFSWCTELGIRLIQRYPTLFRAYVGSGQAVNGARNEEIAYRLALEQARTNGHPHEVRLLERVGPPVAGQYRPVVKGLLTQRQVASRQHPLLSGGGGVLGSVLGGPLFSLEYSAGDLWGFARGATRSIAELWPQITDYDFLTDASRLPVPVTFLQGRHDWTTPSVLVKEYAETLRAPGVRLVWFEKSGHDPMATEPAKFRAELLRALDAVPVPGL